MKKQILFFVCLLVIGIGYGQQSKLIKVPFTKIEQTLQKSSFETVLSSNLKITSGTEFRPVKSANDKLKQTHTTYQQYYNGIKVEMGMVKLHQKNGVNSSYNGAYFDVSGVNTTSQISEQRVISIAQNYFNNKTVFWLNEEGISKNTSPEANLVVLPNRRTNEIHLAYAIGVGVSQPTLKMGILYVDAQTGKVLKFKNLVFSCFDTTENNIVKKAGAATRMAAPLATGTAATVYSSSQSLGTDLDSGNYILYDETRANTGSGHLAGGSAKFGIATVDFNHTTSLNDYNNSSIVTEFEDTDNTWTAAEMNTDEDQYALDAHWGAQVVYDYFKNEQGRNSYDGSNSAIVSYVHYDTNYTNAAWVSFTNNRGFMIYGDGGGSFTPLTTLDVAAHEIAHGITNNTAQLDYELESGALNEGFSDIWAMVIDDYANNNLGTTKNIGEINDENGGGTLRSMSSPNTYGQPDTYGGTYWYDVNNCTPDGTNNDYCGVHTNSGVINYWFWLVVKGGFGTNDIGNLFNVNTIGVDDAAAITYRMQNTYLTPISDYADARTAGIQAAIDLFGSCSQQEESVTNAFYAVGIGSAYQAPITPSFTTQPSNESVAANGTVQFTVEASDYSTIEWYSNDGGGWNSRFDNLTVSGETTTTLTISNVPLSANGLQVRAYILNDCGDDLLSNAGTLSVIEYTSISDTNFEAALEALGYDDISGDGQVPIDNINTLTSLDVSSSNISSLSGIETFAALETLVVNDNSISSLDLSSNTNLTILNARNNGLTSLDVSGCLDMDVMLLENNNLTSLDLSNNTLLTRIWAQNNDFNTLDVTNNPLLRAIGISGSNLTSLDITNNTALQQLYAAGNAITEIDASNCPSLHIISLNSNNLKSLNVQNGNNSNVTNFNTTSNPNLTCITVDNVNYSTTNWTNIDAQTIFTDTSCYIQIPDTNFEAALEALGYDDISGDGQVPMGLIASVTSLDVSGKSISDVTGITDFKALVHLTISDNNLSTLDLSSITTLQSVEAINNQLSSINVTGLNRLDTLLLDTNDLTNLDLTSLIYLQYFSANDNDLEGVDFRTGFNSNIVDIDLRNNNNLTCVSVDDPLNVKNTWLVDNQTSFTATDYCEYTSIPDANFEAVLFNKGFDDIENDLRVPTALIAAATILNIPSDNISDITGIQDFTSLKTLNASNNAFTSIDLSALTALENLTLVLSQLTSLDLSNNISLKNLDVSESLGLDTLDLSNNPLMVILDASECDLSGISLESLILLENLNLSSNKLTNLDLSTLTALEIVNLKSNELVDLNLKNGNSANITFFDVTFNDDLNCMTVDDPITFETTWDATIDAWTTVSTYCNYTSIPDANFEAALEALGYDDISGDNQVPKALIREVTSLDVRSESITNLSGIEDFTALTELILLNNDLTTIDISNNVLLTHLETGYNSLSSLDVSANTALEYLDFTNNNLSALNLQNNAALIYLEGSNNSLLTIDLSQSLLLEAIYVEENLLNSIVIGDNINLSELSIADNQVTELDLSANTALADVDLSSNSLTSLNVQNGNNTNWSLLSLTGNNGLTCVLVDDVAYSEATWTEIDIQTRFSDTAYCDYTAIPDINFETALENLGYDDISGDGRVPTELIEVVTTLDVVNKDISDLTGIEDFVALQTLSFPLNNVSSVDISQNINLESLICRDNNLTSLDVSSNTKLIELNAVGNALGSIDLSTNTNLEYLALGSCGLTSIDLSNNIALLLLDLYNNQLTTLNLSDNGVLEELYADNNALTFFNIQNGNNNNLSDFNVTNNPNLECILVDDVTYSTTNWINIDATTSFSSTYCNYTAISDSNFEAVLEALGYDDISGDGQVPTALIEVVATLSINNQNIADLTGIEDFAALVILEASNNSIVTVDFSANSNLEEIDLKENPLTSINVSSNANLQVLDLNNALFDTIDVSNNAALRNLYITNNINLTSIDLSTNTAIENLSLYGNSLSSITLGNLTSLRDFYIENNSLVTLELTNLTALENLNVVNNNLSSLNIQNGANTNISTFEAYNNPNLTCIQVDDVDYANSTWGLDIDAQTSFSDTACTSGFSLALKVYLQGAALNPNTGEETLMRDDLRIAGSIPTTSPYADGAMTYSSIFNATGNDAIVDWIWVELRDKNDATVVIEGQSALLQRDGDIVTIDGVSNLEFDVSLDSYYMMISHRNHLGILSSNTIALSSIVTNLDFSSDTSLIEGGTNAIADLGGGIYAILSGDYDENGQIQNSDINSVINILGNSGYNNADMNMNGQVQNTDINNVINPNLGKGQQF
ncbi:M4 family metallopeptidase [Aquimarina sp. 2201CG5-10]|uniref:M4 family metallopeptidase n=1 Tax=Aquimarina callyspongiae TaxID=3098150 RepID=UPI002AB4732E|nr:M4 family metallopeptidase [Aquimarina sp. 2201CG5-10]MDY8138021.1 M4 family metallopeptidase [Aquimarina sp. 2201CG5-10]